MVDDTKRLEVSDPQKGFNLRQLAITLVGHYLSAALFEYPLDPPAEVDSIILEAGETTTRRLREHVLSCYADHGITTSGAPLGTVEITKETSLTKLIVLFSDTAGKAHHFTLSIEEEIWTECYLPLLPTTPEGEQPLRTFEEARALIGQFSLEMRLAPLS